VTNREQGRQARARRGVCASWGTAFGRHTRARTVFAATTRGTHDDDDVRDDDFDDDDDGGGDAGNQGGGETDDDDESSARVRFISPIDDDARERRVSRVL